MFTKHAIKSSHIISSCLDAYGTHIITFLKKQIFITNPITSHVVEI